MGYYLRVFCTSEKLPALRDVFGWSASEGIELQAPSADLDARDWDQAEIIYKADKQPFVAERNTDELLREEVEEFIEFLEDVDDSPERDRVINHLRQSRAVVATQLLGDIDDDGYTAVGTFLSFFADHAGGLIQADGEGFYEGDRLIVELQ
jgi:hypothetical protein